MSATFLITLQAGPGKEAALESAMTSVNADLPSVEGCSGVTTLRHPSDEGAYTLIESWQSEAHHQRHVQGLVDSGAWTSLLELLRDEPTGRYVTTL